MTTVAATLKSYVERAAGTVVATIGEELEESSKGHEHPRERRELKPNPLFIQLLTVVKGLRP